MTGKGIIRGLTIGFVIVAVGGCAILHVIRHRIEGEDAVRSWAASLGTTEDDMLLYLTRATGIHNRERLNSALSGRSAGWSAFYTRNDPAFDDLIRRYEGVERDRNISVRASLHRLAKQMAAVQMAYDQGNQSALDGRIYGGMLQELAGTSYSKLEKLASRDPASPFLSNDDAEIWALVRRFVAMLEAEAQRSVDLSRAFSGIRFDETLMVIERMRHERVVHVLLVNLPTHHALGELFTAFQNELPRP